MPCGRFFLRLCAMRTYRARRSVYPIRLHTALCLPTKTARGTTSTLSPLPRARARSQTTGTRSPVPSYPQIPHNLKAALEQRSSPMPFTPHLVRRSLPGPCGCPVTSIRYASSSLHPSPIQKSLRLHSRPRFRFTLPMRWLRPFIAYPHPSLLSPYSLAIIPRARAFRCRLPHEYRRPQARRVATL